MSTPADRDPDQVRTGGDVPPPAPSGPDAPAAAPGASPVPPTPPPPPVRTTALPSTGQHAVARPAPPTAPLGGRGAVTGSPDADRVPDDASTAAGPTPAHEAAPATPPPAPEPVAAAAPAPAPGPATDAGTAPASAGATAVDAGRRARRGEPLPVAHEDLPERPARPGAGRHVLGVLLGLLLTPIALLLTGIGTSRLADAAGASEPLGDALGITLLALGVVLLVVVVLLGAWSPAVPITGGLVWGVGLGVAYLVAPGIMTDTVDALVGDRALPAVVEQLTDAALSGLLLVTGALLLASGIAAGRARRSGRRWAEGVARADLARLEAEHRDRRPAPGGATAASSTPGPTP